MLDPRSRVNEEMVRVALVARLMDAPPAAARDRVLHTRLLPIDTLLPLMNVRAEVRRTPFPSATVLLKKVTLETTRERPPATVTLLPLTKEIASRAITPAGRPTDCAVDAIMVSPSARVRLLTPPSVPSKEKDEATVVFKGSNRVAPAETVTVEKMEVERGRLERAHNLSSCGRREKAALKSAAEAAKTTFVASGGRGTLPLHPKCPSRQRWLEVQVKSTLPPLPSGWPIDNVLAAVETDGFHQRCSDVGLREPMAMLSKRRSTGESLTYV